MMHFFRRSKIHLDTFTYRRDVIEYAPIKLGAEALPEWWKKLPKETHTPQTGFFPIPTMKTCAGVIDYYTKSVCMPLWSDLAIEVHADGGYRWQFADTLSSGEVHPKAQYTGMPITSHMGHLKINSPWIFNTKKDLFWMLTNPIYDTVNCNEYALAVGLLNFYRQQSTNLQLFIDTTTPKVINIPFGTTFLFTPLTDKKITLHRHLISPEEYDSKNQLGVASTFINKYQKQRKISKCPYKDKTK